MLQDVSAKQEVVNYQPTDNLTKETSHTKFGKKVTHDKSKKMLTLTKFFVACYNKVKSLASYIIKVVTDIIKNRIILAHLLGLVILPSQFLYRHEENQKVIDKACAKNNFEKIDISDGNLQIQAVICYPPDWDKSNKSNCSLFHSPNAMLVSQFIDTNYNIKKNSIIAELLKKGPVILYDYPNTGINRNINKGITRHIPILKNTTEHKILDCAESIVKYTVKHFDQVNVIGMSLGGAVGTIALQRYLSKNENIERSRFQLSSIDSFTTMPRVVLTNSFKIADILGWLLGVNMDAETAMRYLISCNIKTLVFNHPNDSIIPERARMYKLTQNYIQDNVTSILGLTGYNHCDMHEQLAEALNKFKV